MTGRYALSRLGIVVACLCLCLVSAGYGAAAVRYRLFPYPQLQWQFHRWYYARNPYPEAPQADLSLMTLADEAGLQRARRDLTRLIWASEALPSRLPDAIEAGNRDPRYRDIPSVERIETLRVRMDFGIDSNVVHLVSSRPNGALVLVHHGHADVAEMRPVIAALVERGYGVAAFSMPLFGGNSRPVIRAGQMGPITLSNHDTLRLIEPATGLREKYLLEPVPVVLNYLIPRRGYRRVAMVGLSGGGWTTAMAAALDPRISKSFPVAGTLPFDLGTGSGWGDLEQTDAAIYSRFSWLDLYLLGATGRGRRQLQILNEFDPCCFAGRAALTYRAAVAERARRLGGRFDLLIDSTHEEHKISDWAMGRILTALEE